MSKKNKLQSIKPSEKELFEAKVKHEQAKKEFERKKTFAMDKLIKPYEELSVDELNIFHETLSQAIKQGMSKFVGEKPLSDLKLKEEIKPDAAKAEQYSVALSDLASEKISDAITIIELAKMEMEGKFEFILKEKVSKFLVEKPKEQSEQKETEITK